MTSPLRIRLVPYDYSRTVDSNRLVQLFPESLFASTITVDPTVEVIEISNPEITPGVLDYIVTMVETGKTPLISEGLDLTPAYRYLAIDVMEALADPNSNNFIQGRPDVNLLNLAQLDQSAYYTILYYGLTIPIPGLVTYLFKYTTPDRHRAEDEKALIVSIIKSSPFTLKLLDHGINPTLGYLTPDEYRNIVPSNGQDVSMKMSLSRANQALYYATLFGQLEVVRRLILYPDVNIAFISEGIINALETGHLDIVALLFQHNIYVDSSQSRMISEKLAEYGDTPLFRRYLDLIPKLGQTLPASIISSIVIGFIRGGHIDQAKQQFNTNVHPNERRRLNREVLPVAVKYNQIDFVTQILHDNQLPILSIRKAFLSSVKLGHSELAKILSGDPRITDKALRRGFHYAIMNGYSDLFLFFLANPRINPNVMGLFVTALSAAVFYNRLSFVRMLLEDKRVNPAQNDNIAVILASRHGHLEVLQLLLADPRIDPTARRNTAIGNAYQRNHFDVVKLLRSDPRVRMSLEQERNNPTVLSILNLP